MRFGCIALIASACANDPNEPIEPVIPFSVDVLINAYLDMVAGSLVDQSFVDCGFVNSVTGDLETKFRDARRCVTAALRSRTNFRVRWGLYWIEGGGFERGFVGTKTTTTGWTVQFFESAGRSNYPPGSPPRDATNLVEPCAGMLHVDNGCDPFEHLCFVCR